MDFTIPQHQEDAHFMEERRGLFMASAILDNMYNYYLTTYGKSTVSRYDSHKKSELRSVYNNIVKINKESPLYKIKDSADAQKFAIDIKEHARDLKNVIASLSTGDSLAESTILLCLHSVWMSFLVFCHVVITLLAFCAC